MKNEVITIDNTHYIDCDVILRTDEEGLLYMKEGKLYIEAVDNCTKADIIVTKDQIIVARTKDLPKEFVDKFISYYNNKKFINRVLVDVELNYTPKISCTYLIEYDEQY
jgi:hypothetical protein